MDATAERFMHYVHRIKADSLLRQADQEEELDRKVALRAEAELHDDVAQEIRDRVMKAAALANAEFLRELRADLDRPRK